MTTFGDKIRKLRKEKKMTQQKLGDMVGVSHRTIRSWEVEGRYPKQSSLYQKLRHFGAVSSSGMDAIT